ncbi:uncharacterized protein MELLADRAFT_90482 [Melampsora larici-populina 98AG31]|uniref:Uncharacterized protein n=1 Tax=Melampsora larici-populina (strain 98AG31 / pathotype 3-4-7) TaxID=747676 RepID=F4RX25_MELLP|nr:uncharacterized protein MELLADRAFT_90482 [Melampsora larici-populina 98AG31]EGG02886.1 hypothetical protein MELLADRAFT_90482 [Melampsora larici-populina 98AG31]
MSTPVQFHIFLPSYILQYVVNEPRPRIDSDLFLSKATTSQIVEVILSFYPYFRFTQNAQEDHELLLKIFVEMIAPRLYYILIHVGPNTDYIQAQLSHPISIIQPSIRWVNSSADIDAGRIDHFNEFCLPNLKNGQYRLAAEAIKEFARKFEYLNHNEIGEILSTHDDALENYHELGGNLQVAYKSIEKINLQLLEPNLSLTSFQDLENKFKLANTSLKSHQDAMEVATKDAALLHALASYHKEVLEKQELNGQK